MCVIQEKKKETHHTSKSSMHGTMGKLVLVLLIPIAHNTEKVGARTFWGLKYQFLAPSQTEK